MTCNKKGVPCAGAEARPLISRSPAAAAGCALHAPRCLPAASGGQSGRGPASERGGGGGGKARVQGAQKGRRGQTERLNAPAVLCFNRNGDARHCMQGNKLSKRELPVPLPAPSHPGIAALYEQSDYTPIQRHPPPQLQSAGHPGGRADLPASPRQRPCQPQTPWAPCRPPSAQQGKARPKGGSTGGRSGLSFERGRAHMLPGQ